MCTNIKEYVKNLFQGIASIILCKRSVSGNVKDGAQELEVRSLNHPYSLKTKSSQCQYVVTP